MEEVFNQILDKDENIIKIIKPNKAKMFWSLFFKSFFLWIVFSLCIGFAFGQSFGTSKILEDGTESVDLNLTAFLISVLVITFIFIVVDIVVFYLKYTKTFYAYTNKRVLIRHGIIGVDYKSLDKKSIGAVTVNVSLLDKIVRQNTGTIVFGSMSSPIITNSNGTTSDNFKFANIKNPYDIYQEIKSNIDETQNKKDLSAQKSKEIVDDVPENPVEEPLKGTKNVEKKKAK